VPTALLASIIMSGHPGTAALHSMLVLAVLAVLLAGQGYAVYRSSRGTSPRPRRQYFLFCAGYLTNHRDYQCLCWRLGGRPPYWLAQQRDGLADGT
jgi:hypothetical protein